MGRSVVECDQFNFSILPNPDGTTACRCIVCARCGRHTGNATQGHYWGFCDVTKKIEKFHFCCPGNCELHPSIEG